MNGDYEMNKYIEKFAEIAGCQEIQDLMQVPNIGDQCFCSRGLCTVKEPYLPGLLVSVWFEDPPCSANLDRNSLIILPPVSSILYPKRSLTGAIPEHLFMIYRKYDGWSVLVRKDKSVESECFQALGPILEIAMVEAVRWWIKVVKKGNKS
jgi:hypothetical protein